MTDAEKWRADLEHRQATLRAEQDNLDRQWQQLASFEHALAECRRIEAQPKCKVLEWRKAR